MNKKIIYTAIFSLAMLTVDAQQNIINGSFEDTVIIRDNQSVILDTVAADWTFTSFGGGISSDAYSGSTSAYIWNWYYYAKGELINGTTDFFQGGGTPVNFRPDYLSGYFKYITGEVQTVDDSASAIICLTRFNTSIMQRDTIGFGIKKLGASTVYKPFQVNVEYRSSEMPDTVIVRFISSDNGFCSNTSSGNCLFLYVDDVSISNATGVIDNVLFTAHFLFPNPVGDMLNIELPKRFVTDDVQITVVSVTGEVVMQHKTNGEDKIAFNTTQLAAGIYTVRIMDVAERSLRFIKQ